MTGLNTVSNLIVFFFIGNLLVILNHIADAVR